MSSGLDDLFGKWDKWYPGCPPIPYLLMTDFADRWGAIYDQPRDNPAKNFEQQIVLERHAAVTADVLGVGSQCAAILTLHDQAPAPSWVKRFDATVTDHWRKQWATHPVYATELRRMKMAVATCVWPPVFFADMILDVSRECLAADVFFVALDSGRAYAPGVGGAGFFVEDMPTAHALWDKYWTLGWTPPELYSPSHAGRTSLPN